MNRHRPLRKLAVLSAFYGAVVSGVSGAVGEETEDESGPSSTTQISGEQGSASDECAPSSRLT